MLAGFDTSDGVGGVVGAAVATLLKLPYLSSAAKIEPDPDGRNGAGAADQPAGFDVLEAPMPALIVGTQLLGEPRYPSLKGIMARAIEGGRRTKSLADLGLDAGRRLAAAAARTDGHAASETAGSRRDAGRARHARRKAPRRSSSCSPRGGSSDGRRDLGRRRDERRRLAGEELHRGRRRSRGRSPGGRRRTEAAGIVVAADPKAAAEELAGYVPRVVAVAEPLADGHAWAQVAAQRGQRSSSPPRRRPLILTGAGPDGRDVAGTLLALLDGAVLVNATAVDWDDGGPSVEMSVFGGKLVTTSAFADGEWGIITVRPNVVTAEPAGSPGKVETAKPRRRRSALPLVKVVDRLEEAARRRLDRGGADHRGRRSRRRRRGRASRSSEEIAEPARRRGRRDARRGRFGLDPVCPADRPDRQDRQAAALPRDGHLRRDPAQGRDADRGHDHRDQPRP